MRTKRILVVGGGAAGYFCAIAAAGNDPEAKVVIAEAGAKTLKKVGISGGGRCNVTHACFDPKQLVRNYPRGHRELRGPFSRFNASDTVTWFESRGVKLKTEEDGRMFPVTDSSETIIQCLEKARKEAAVDLWLKTKVNAVKEGGERRFEVALGSREGERREAFDAVMLATGSGKGGYALAQSLGHAIEPLVPSLFTFEIDDPRLEGIAGVSVAGAEVELSFGKGKRFAERGPVLVTHWGLSGPAVIKLSAWAARPLFEVDYRADLKVNWVSSARRGAFVEQLDRERTGNPKRQVASHPVVDMPKRLWEKLCTASGIERETRFAELPRKMAARLEEEVFAGVFRIHGKGVFKEEFVTCGGVRLREVDLRTMESKLVPGLHFGGELLDIDGVTGGFNFQNAWTTGYIAGVSI